MAFIKPQHSRATLRLGFVCRLSIPRIVRHDDNDLRSICGGGGMLDEGVWAEIKVAGEHLRLFSEHNAQGVQTSVYDVNAKKWIAPSEAVEDIEEGKEKATEYAKVYLQRANLELPPLVWKKARAI
jgi:hypothetical protein